MNTTITNTLLTLITLAKHYPVQTLSVLITAMFVVNVVKSFTSTNKVQLVAVLALIATPIIIGIMLITKAN